MPKIVGDSEFVPVSPEEGKSLLKEAIRQICSTVVWTKDQKIVVNTHLGAANELDEKLTVWVPREHELRSLDTELRKSPEQCYFSISLTRANILFRSSYQGSDGQALTFQYPQEIFKIQRRKNFRLPIPDGYVVKVEFTDPILPSHRLSRRVHDISAGGLSFVTPLDEEPLFRAGTKLTATAFKLKGKDIQAECEVRHTRELKGSKTPSLKVGCEFTQIRPGDSQHIAAYVFEESRKYLTNLF